MGVMSTAYSEATGAYSEGGVTSYLSGLGIQAGLGMGISYALPSFSYGREYLKAGNNRLFRGGWGSGIAQAAKHGSITPFGWAPVEGGKGFGFGGVKGTNFSSIAHMPLAAKARMGLGSIMGGYAIYSGYKEGGIIGAVKGAADVAIGSAFWSMGEAAGSRLGLSGIGRFLGPIGIAATAMVGLGITSHQALQYGQNVHKRIRNTEFVQPIVDQFGTMSTMRQRSLQAIQRSQINGRAAMGNEAFLLSGMMR